MFDYIKGTLIDSSACHAVVETNGIGYKILIPISALSHLRERGSEVQFFTSFIVREQSQTLYGFFSVAERQLFEMLIDVSGIGQKTALSIIGHLSEKDLQRAVSIADVKAISKVPGIGKKTAERLIIEMRDKISYVGSKEPLGRILNHPTDPSSQKMSDAISALINLGYSPNIAEKAVQKGVDSLPESPELGTLITASLKKV